MWTLLRGTPPEYPLTKLKPKNGDDILNKESDKKVRIKVRLSEEENEKLERCSALCGLSQSEFIRQLCKGKAPKPQPQKEFWELLNALYDVHNMMKKV